MVVINQSILSLLKVNVKINRLNIILGTLSLFIILLTVKKFIRSSIFTQNE